MAHCGYLVTEDGRFLNTEDGRRLVTECFTPETTQEGFGLARLFYYQREQRRKRRQREEEELLALIGTEL